MKAFLRRAEAAKRRGCWVVKKPFRAEGLDAVASQSVADVVGAAHADEDRLGNAAERDVRQGLHMLQIVSAKQRFVLPPVDDGFAIAADPHIEHVFVVAEIELGALAEVGEGVM